MEELNQQLSDLRFSTLRKNQAKEVYRQLSGSDELPQPIMPKRLQSGNVGANFQVKTNSFNIEIGKNSTVYLYRVNIVGIRLNPNGDTYRLDLNVIPKEDGFSVEHRYSLFNTIDKVFEKFKNQLPSRFACYYDSGNQLYSLEKIDQAIQGHVFSLDNEEVKQLWQHKNGIDHIDIEFVSTEQTFHLGQALKEEPSGGFRCLQQCIDVMTSQQTFQDRTNHVVFQGGKSFMIDPTAYGYHANDSAHLPNGCYIGIGCQKSVQIVTEGDVSRPVLVIEPKKAVFHDCSFVSEKMVSMFGEPCLTQPWDDNSICRAEKLIQKLVVVMSHIRGRLAQIKGIDKRNAHELMFEYEGANISVYQYYMKRHNMKLKFPSMPLLVSKSRNNLFYLPMEVCGIVDNQRLPHASLEINQQSELIKACTIEPRFYQDHVFRNAKSLNLLSDNFLKYAGVQVNTCPIQAAARQLPAPSMVYGDGSKDFNVAKWNWAAPRRYYKCSDVGKWGFYWTDGAKQLNQNQFNILMESFGNSCKKFGINIQYPADTRNVDSITTEKLEDIFKYAQKNNFQFILVITNPKNTRVHSDLKYFERKYLICTQNVTSKVFIDGFGNNKNITAENIIAKLNCKNGGLNYTLDSKNLNFAQELYISYGVSAAFTTVSGQASGKDILFVGYASNDLKNINEFSGDYFYQEGSSDVDYNVISEIVTSCLKRWHSHRNSFPLSVVIYRNGVSEGQKGTILGTEVPIVRKILSNFSSSIRLVFITCTKSHNFRFYSKNIEGRNAMEQNLKPGTVVDTGVVSSTIPEFFLQSHLGRLGTAKVPKYSVYANDAEYDMNKLELMTYGLTFGHQIIRQSISIPLPCAMALSLADRARRNFIAHSTTATGAGATSASNYLHTINQSLRYDNTPLREIRFNA